MNGGELSVLQLHEQPEGVHEAAEGQEIEEKGADVPDDDGLLPAGSRSVCRRLPGLRGGIQ